MITAISSHPKLAGAMLAIAAVVTITGLIHIFDVINDKLNALFGSKLEEKLHEVRLHRVRLFDHGMEVYSYLATEDPQEVDGGLEFYVGDKFHYSNLLYIVEEV